MGKLGVHPGIIFCGIYRGWLQQAIKSKNHKIDCFVRGGSDGGGGGGGRGGRGRGGVEVKFWKVGRRGGYENWTSTNKEDGEPKCWAFCDNVIIERPNL